MALKVGAAFGRVVAIEVNCSHKQLTASNTAQPNKVYPGIKGRIVGIRGNPGVIGYGTIPTDLDLTVKKNTTALHSVDIPLIDSSTLATTDAVLSPTLVALAATRAIDVNDYLACDAVITGGSTPTLDGTGVIVYIARE